MYQKVMITGNLVEQWEYKYPHLASNKGKKHHPERSDEYYADSLSNTRNTIRTLIAGNFSRPSSIRPKFITLTFKNTKKFDVSNLSDCNDRHQIFIKKMQQEFGNFKYVMIPELQKKRNAIHYHIICILPFIDKKKLHKLWPYGYSDIRVTPPIMKAIKYLTKYLTKDFSNDTFKGKRKLYTSLNLLRPILISNSEDSARLIGCIDRDHAPLLYRYSYDSNWLGEIWYTAYLIEENNINEYYKVTNLAYQAN